jgi:hypothetical protein
MMRQAISILTIDMNDEAISIEIAKTAHYSVIASTTICPAMAVWQSCRLGHFNLRVPRHKPDM